MSVAFTARPMDRQLNLSGRRQRRDMQGIRKKTEGEHCRRNQIDDRHAQDRAPEQPQRMVELDEGVRIMADLINVTEDQVKIGMKVKPVWIPLPEGYNLIAYEPR